MAPVSIPDRLNTTAPLRSRLRSGTERDRKGAVVIRVQRTCAVPPQIEQPRASLERPGAVLGSGYPLFKDSARVLGLATLAFATFTESFQSLFPTLGAVSGSLHQLATHEFEQCLFGAIAFPTAHADDPAVAAIALGKAR